MPQPHQWIKAQSNWTSGEEKSISRGFCLISGARKNKRSRGKISCRADSQAWATDSKRASWRWGLFLLHSLACIFFPRQTSNKCVIHAISKKTEQGKATERERERDNEMQTLLEYFFSFPLPSVYFILVFFGAWRFKSRLFIATGRVLEVRGAVVGQPGRDAKSRLNEKHPADCQVNSTVTCTGPHHEISSKHIQRLHRFWPEPRRMEFSLVMNWRRRRAFLIIPLITIQE